MHDYQLERLNTRSFEQLVQALGLEIIGKQLMIFGDGPDGGREATFEGQVKYPEGKKQWNGYGILQAKFRQQPDSLAKKNANWAITQLRAEFSKLKPRSKRFEIGGRTCPEYYIFATNLALSPVAKKGGKDRVRAVLNGFKRSHGLKNYAIWDGDQICRFLDANPGIRTTYAAWLLPGDVLAEMMNHLKLQGTDFPSTIRRYLESELLDDQYARLGQGGYTDANAIPLSRVFIDLPVELSSEAVRTHKKHSDDPAETDEDADQKRPTFLELFFEEGRQVLKPSANPRRPSENLLFRRTAGRVVLIGGPGQGKTTVGQFACQLLRAALLRVTPANYSPEVTQALARIEQHSGDLPKIHVLRYPLRVDLKRLAEALAGEGDFVADSLFEYLVRHISKRTDSNLSKSEFRKWLTSYPWLLVLDGLDEVPASSNRAKVMNAIRDFVSVEAHQQDADLLILATTRPQGYSDEFDPAFYKHLPLAPLTASDALNYGTRLAEARHPGLKTRIEELGNSLKRATANPATVRLMESPLQVTIMLALIEGGGEPPEQRWKLFHDYYDVIYRREKERGTPFSALLGKYEPDIHWLHHRAGWILQQRNAAAGATAARLTHTDFQSMVDARLRKRGHVDDVQRSNLVNQIREAATDRLVFLVGNTAREIGFEIRSLQEFMAAEHCFDGSESCVQDTVRAIAPHPYWRNVFLFVAGRIFFEKESLIDSLIVACERLNETLTDHAQGVISAGSRLALSMLKDGIARNQPENSRVLSRCASRLMDGQDFNEAAALVSLFTSETAEVWKDELLARLQETSAMFPHLPWRLCLELAGNIEWAEQVMQALFPWTQDEVEDFLFAAIPKHRLIPNSFWVSLKRYVFVHSPSMWGRVLWQSKLPDVLNVEPFTVIAAIYGSSDQNETSTLVNELGQKTGNSLWQLGTTRIKNWSALKIKVADMGKLHSTWRTFHAVSEFAREFSAQSLAQRFSEMIESDPFCETESVMHPLPWQVHACLTAKASGIPLPQIISAVGSGTLGDTEEWHRWSSPNESGISIGDLGFRNGLISASDGHQGAVYGNAGWIHGSAESKDNFEFADALVAAMPRLLPGSQILEHLVNLCCFGLYTAHPNWRRKDLAAVKRIVSYCRDTNIAMTREIIAAVVGSSLEIHTKIELLIIIDVRIGTRSWLDRWDERSLAVNECCRQIVAAIGNSDDVPAVLGSLSFLPALPFTKAIPPSALEKCRLRDAYHRQAAIALQINSLEWHKQPQEIAADAVSLRERYPAHLEELLKFIDSEGVNGNHLELFVVELMKTPALKRKVWFLARLAGVLVNLVERRPAIDLLPDPVASKAVNGGRA